MGSQFGYQAPLRFGDVPKRDPRTQFAALCYRRRKSEVEVLLVSSLETRRWIIPKGWPEDGLTPAGSAAQEAWEEAGVRGKAHDQCVGIYSYTKTIDGTLRLPVIAAVFAVEVKGLSTDYPEAGLRKRRWFSPKKAASRVREIELKQILREFDPSILR